MLMGQNTSLAAFIQWCWWCRGCELLQGHSDIKVTDAAGINHIGKVYCGNFDCKLKARRMSGIKLLDIHNPSSATAPSLKVIVWIFGICCFLMLSVYLYPVFSIIQIKHSFLYWAHLCNGEEVILLMINCVGNKNEGEYNFDTWQRRNRTKSQYSSKLKRCWGPEGP